MLRIIQTIIFIHFFVASHLATDFNTIVNSSSIEKVANRKDNHHVRNTLVKYKKKYKITTPVFAGLKQPVKDVDPLFLYICSKETYSKPHFLSHLHHFLFRLTPF